MKKLGFLFSVFCVLVLALSFTACDPDELDRTGFADDLPDDLVKKLKDLGVKSFVSPAGCEFDGWEGQNKMVAIAWTGGDTSKLNTYKTALTSQSRATDAIISSNDITSTFPSLDFADVGLVSIQGDVGGTSLQVTANSIVFVGGKD